MLMFPNGSILTAIIVLVFIFLVLRARYRCGANGWFSHRWNSDGVYRGRMCRDCGKRRSIKI